MLAGGTAGFAKVVFALFTIARLGHSVFYLAEKQPWRTLMFTAGGIATLALFGQDIWLIIRGAG